MKKKNKANNDEVIARERRKIKMKDPVNTVNTRKVKVKNQFWHGQLGLKPKIQAQSELGPRHIQSPVIICTRHIQITDTVEPATCTCQAVFIFMDTMVESSTRTRRHSVSNISQPIYLFLYLFVNKFEKCLFNICLIIFYICIIIFESKLN